MIIDICYKYINYNVSIKLTKMIVNKITIRECADTVGCHKLLIF